MWILGINAFHGDASAAIIRDGQLVVAVEEERFNRIKHWAGFPLTSIRFCLEHAGVRLEDLDHIAISRNPSAHLHKKILFSVRRGPSFELIKSRLSNASKIYDIQQILSSKFNMPPEKIKAKIHHIEHHRTHLASSFFLSPFENAALLSVDGFGDFVSCMWGIGEGNKMKIDRWVEFPHSMGILYTAISQFLGFPNYGDEYKVMGLSACGEPEYSNSMRQLLKSNNGLGFQLDLRYFLHHSQGLQMTWEDGYPKLSVLYSNEMTSLLGNPRQTAEPIERRHENIACSLQQRLEEVLFHLLNKLHERTGLENLCLAGGVALNCVANGKITDFTPFRKIYIQPAANDAGTSIGAAYYVYHSLLGEPRSFQMDHTYYGTDYSKDQMEEMLRESRLPYRELNQDNLTEWTADQIAEGKVVGWFQGRMEFGPRALGNRSILVDPRRPDMKDILNKRIKHREPFRPFAPSIKEEKTADYFEKSEPSPFMLMTYKVKVPQQKRIPAPTHVDGTGRLQTVSRFQNPLYWKLLDSFEKKTGIPVLLNTSFNENEPIVNSPQEALECFLRTKMDVLVLGPFVLEKNDREHPQSL
jgi:carbamoyltransferase